MAEGLAKKILGPSIQIQSAGSKPATVNPYAIQALREIGIDISQSHSKSIDSLPKEFLDSIDFVITLCAEEVCPVVISTAKKIHWPLPDPAQVPGSDEYKLQRFRDVRDELKNHIENFKLNN
jgi:arsenate reductase